MTKVYAVDYDNMIITLIDPEDYNWDGYDTFDTFKQAKMELVKYWVDMKAGATVNIRICKSRTQ